MTVYMIGRPRESVTPPIRINLFHVSGPVNIFISVNQPLSLATISVRFANADHRGATGAGSTGTSLSRTAFVVNLCVPGSYCPVTPFFVR